MDTLAPDASPDPAVLTDLVAAGLVSHEMIGDPVRLPGEAAALQALCAVVGGTVYRLGAFHYAFRADPGDLGGQLGALLPGDWTQALEAALQAALGADSVCLNAAGLLDGEDVALDQPLMLLRAQGTAVAEALVAAPPAVQVVVNARYATETARLTAQLTADLAASGSGGPLAARLAAIEARQAEILEAVQVLVAAEAGRAQALKRLEAQSTLLQERAATRPDFEHRMAARLEEIAARPGDFEERLGLSLAEFLARLEQAGAFEPAGAQAPAVPVG